MLACASERAITARASSWIEQWIGLGDRSIPMDGDSAAIPPQSSTRSAGWTRPLPRPRALRLPFVWASSDPYYHILAHERKLYIGATIEIQGCGTCTCAMCTCILGTYWFQALTPNKVCVRACVHHVFVVVWSHEPNHRCSLATL